MKHIQNITTLLLAMTLVLILSACNTKTSQDDNNTTGAESNSTQTDANTTTVGEETNTTTDDNNSTDTNTTTTPTVTLKSLNLRVNKTSLNKDENTIVNVMATYSDNSSKEVTGKVEWVTVPNNTVEVTNTTLTALQDKATTVKAKLKGKTSNAIDLNITWVVNGHTLPPEPDKALNDATLFGIDTNNNGVRDDVERYIYKKYPVKLHQALLMNGAKFFQKTLIKPISQAQKLAKEDTKNIDCELFLGDVDKTIDSDDWFENSEELKNFIFNTKNRIRKYLDYNLALSGGVYGSSPSDWNRDACSEEIRKVLEEMGK